MDHWLHRRRRCRLHAREELGPGRRFQLLRFSVQSWPPCRQQWHYRDLHKRQRSDLCRDRAVELFVRLGWRSPLLIYPISSNSKARPRAGLFVGGTARRTTAEGENRSAATISVVTRPRVHHSSKKLLRRN